MILIDIRLAREYRIDRPCPFRQRIAAYAVELVACDRESDKHRVVLSAVEAGYLGLDDGSAENFELGSVVALEI